jgi:hypothetical protein
MPESRVDQENIQEIIQEIEAHSGGLWKHDRFTVPDRNHYRRCGSSPGSAYVPLWAGQRVRGG